jgi:ectoine hydroxylase
MPYPVDVPWKNGMPASALATTSEPFEQLRKAA